MNPEEDWLLSVLRDRPYWPIGDAERRSAEGVLSVASAHGVLPLITDKLRSAPIWHLLPDDLRQGLLRRTWGATLREVNFEQEVRRNLAMFAAHGHQVLVLKGAGLAYSLYPKPELRTRCDVDLLLPDRSDAERVWRRLEPLGYRREPAVSGDYVSHQYACTKTHGSCTQLVLDIHWQLSNSNYLAQRFSFDELWQQRNALIRLGEHAYTIGFVHALVLALFHRIRHLGAGQRERLIWLYDIDLLCHHLDDTQWTDFEELVADRPLGALCADGLHEAARRYASPVPEDLLRRIGGRGRQARRQLALKRPGIRRELAEFQSLPRWSQRIGFVRELLFPPASYMRQRFGATGPITLTVAYLRRMARGLGRLVSTGIGKAGGGGRHDD